MLRKSEQLDDEIDAAPDVGLGHARQHRVALQRGLRAPFRIYRDQLGQVPDAVALDVLSRWQSLDLDGPGRGAQVTEHHRDESGLAGSVWAGDAEYLAPIDHQRKLLDRFYRVA